MKTFKLYFGDLNDEAKKRFLEFEEIESEEEGNYEYVPIAEIHRAETCD